MRNPFSKDAPNPSPRSTLLGEAQIALGGITGSGLVGWGSSQFGNGEHMIAQQGVGSASQYSIIVTEVANGCTVRVENAVWVVPEGGSVIEVIAAALVSRKLER